MTTKHISVDLEAYERLRSAKTGSSETFSQVIKRAIWPSHNGTAGKLFELSKGLQNEVFSLSNDELNLLEQAQADDKEADDCWEGDPHS